MPLIEFKINEKLAVVLLVSLLPERQEEVADAVRGGMLSVVRADLPRMRMTSNTGLPTLSSCSMMAMRQ